MTAISQTLTHKEACLLLGASDICLKLSRMTGTLYGHPAPKFIRYGRSVRYLRSDLEAWLAGIPRHQSIAEEAARKVSGYPTAM